MKYQLLPCFQSHNISKNAETHPSPMCEVITDKPLNQAYDLLVHEEYFLIIKSNLINKDKIHKLEKKKQLHHN